MATCGALCYQAPGVQPCETGNFCSVFAPYTCLKEGKCKWVDVPYRVMVPKKIDGLLAVGRSASGSPDAVLCNVTAVPHMGEAGGIAASMSGKQGD